MNTFDEAMKQMEGKRVRLLIRDKSKAGCISACFYPIHKGRVVSCRSGYIELAVSKRKNAFTIWYSEDVIAAVIDIKRRKRVWESPAGAYMPHPILNPNVTGGVDCVLDGTTYTFATIAQALRMFDCIRGVTQSFKWGNESYQQYEILRKNVADLTLNDTISYINDWSAKGGLVEIVRLKAPRCTQMRYAGLGFEYTCDAIASQLFDGEPVCAYCAIHCHPTRLRDLP